MCELDWENEREQVVERVMLNALRNSLVIDEWRILMFVKGALVMFR